MPAKSKADPSSTSTATIGFEAKLWLTAVSKEEMTQIEKRQGP